MYKKNFINQILAQIKNLKNNQQILFLLKCNGNDISA